MYHRPAIDSPQFQAEHVRRLQRYQAMSANEALELAELMIGSDLDWCRTAHHGVIHIEHMPLPVTRNEIMQLCGLNAPYIPKYECPVHITMERMTGRTVDCYVEFQSERDAPEVLHRIKKASESGLGPRVGQSTLEITLSNQDALLNAIFPKAKGIDWVNGWPRARSNRDQGLSSRFGGFLSGEEFRFLVRFANEAERSKYAGKVLQRPYESIMSAISKYATDMYTVHERNTLFQTLIQMIKALVKRLDKGPALGLDSVLINEMVQIGLQCPGSNPRMKFRVAEAARDMAILQRMSKEHLAYFPFETLTWLRPYDVTALTFCTSLIAHGTAEWNEDEGLTIIHGSQWPVPYGRYFFLWDEFQAKERTFSEAVHFELCIFRSLITSGYSNCRPPRTDSWLPSRTSSARPSAQSPISRRATAACSPELSIWPGNQASRVSPQAPMSPGTTQWRRQTDQDSQARTTSGRDLSSSSTESSGGGTTLP